MNKKILLTLILLIVILVGISIFRSPSSSGIDGVSNTEYYLDGKNEVKLVYQVRTKTAILIAPSLGYENLPLTQAISASGARYLSVDSRVEFWEHQGEGRLSVDGKEIFLGKTKQVE